ncbi:hypothetical protein PF005_g27088 [Phytophthora fragariae]|uniref:Uncharacterized protein n=2 Tax=Phytophthora fragariae TaxID=53985 RepID=A0A6A3QV75_9STRA|nr:hypothetical protein PF009_g27634 [Phytophthora fragariae]KAE9070299.1 hypothetical protein PF007_g26991 [Phytophthora fragariae]KAE9083964.1 hypothetical protein PF006_g26572 [Phytophthora fragariae]KAE9171569.1 hypothetical protein PF005_g27088 [Phytophthora fragariae]KAE9180723.1 hypothetical protein PF002_g27483 [Phytophthora fragariae]
MAIRGIIYCAGAPKCYCNVIFGRPACEVWCDETRVFQDDNCPKNFPAAPAKLPYDHDACLGSSRLTIYWIALHSPSWQVYINCAALAKTKSTGATSKFAVGGSSAGTSSSNSTTPATESSSSEQTPSAEQIMEAPTTPATEAPSAEQTTDAPTTDAPTTPTTDAPTVTEAPATESPVMTPAPATSDETSKGSVRRRRRRD